jgi:hypothetical protein
MSLLSFAEGKQVSSDFLDLLRGYLKQSSTAGEVTRKIERLERQRTKSEY